MKPLQQSEWSATQDKALGSRIAAARAAAGVTLQTLADFLGVSKATAGQWETGGRAIKHHDLARLCVALKVSADELLFDRGVWLFDGVDPIKVRQLEPQDLHKLEGGLLLTAAQIGLDIAANPGPRLLPARGEKSPSRVLVRPNADQAKSVNSPHHDESPQTVGVAITELERSKAWSQQAKTNTPPLSGLVEHQKTPNKAGRRKA